MRLTQKFAVSLTGALLGAALIPAAFAGKTESFTGTVSDAMCGAKHMMPGRRGLSPRLRPEGLEVRLGCRRQSLHIRYEGQGYAG